MIRSPARQGSVRVGYDPATRRFTLYEAVLGHLRHGIDAIAADLHQVLKVIDGRL